MNKLVEIVIRWITYICAFHINKMYNAILLLDVFWRYQMYFWRNDLDLERPSRRKVIKTLIYGVRLSAGA